MSTIETPLTGRIPLVNSDKGTPIPLCFVFQLANKLTPSQVKPNRRRCDFQWLDVLFYQEGDKVALSFIFGDGDTAWLTPIGQWTMPRDVERGIHLRKSQGMPIPGESIARIGSSLLVPLLFEGGIVSTPFKEVAKGLIKMPKSLLERNRRNLIEPQRFFLLLEQDQALRSPFIVQRSPRW